MKTEEFTDPFYRLCHLLGRLDAGVKYAGCAMSLAEVRTELEALLEVMRAERNTRYERELPHGA